MELFNTESDNWCGLSTIENSVQHNMSETAEARSDDKEKPWDS